MRKASIPYEIREQKLYMPPVAWPLRCPCCGREEAMNKYELKHMAQYQRSATPTTSSSSGYALEWQVPYCERCVGHEKPASSITPAMLVIGVLLTVTFGIVVGQVVPILLFIAGLVVAGVILYQVLQRVIVFPRMTSTCATPHCAVLVSDKDDEVFFHFYNDEYAKQFADVNHVELTDDAPPRLVGGMKWK